MILCQYGLFAQRPVFVSQDDFSADWFNGFDNFGSAYFVRDNTFYKKKEAKLLQYNTISLGKIKHVDLQNPLNIVLLYADFNTVVILDNQLNETQRINFSEYPDPLVVTATGIASQNRLWVYNSLTQQLGLYDYLKNNYVPITQSMTGNIHYYETDFNTFQWIDDQQNWFSCDVFGKIASHGKVPVSNALQFVSATSLLYFKDGVLNFFDGVKSSPISVDLPKKTVLGFWYGQQNLSIFTTEGISNFKIKLP